MDPVQSDESQADTVAFLSAPETHGQLDPVKRIDTHGAIVFLTREFAYKIKRNVRFPFLDYSTLSLRETACRRELDINRANAPDIYLDVVAITRDHDGAVSFDGDGRAIEWAVKMRRFDENATLDRLCDQDSLAPELMDDLARTMANAHAIAPPANGSLWINDLSDYVEQNEIAFRAAPTLFSAVQVHALTQTARSLLLRIDDLLRHRSQGGHIRICHGDAHLGNIVLIDDTPILFDAIEFDDRIASGDVLYDLGFLLMDLWQRGQPDLASRLFNRYIEITHDDDDLCALAALPLFLMMRAAIRAKIAGARSEYLEKAEKEKSDRAARDLFEFSLSLLEPSEPLLIAIGGLSGSGKSTLARAVAPRIGRTPGALVIRSDAERKKLFEVDIHAPLPDAAYRPEVSTAVYRSMRERARAALAAGHSVVLDAVFSNPEERAAVETLAQTIQVPFVGIWLEAPTTVLEERLIKRTADASDATVETLKKQLDYPLGDIIWNRLDAHSGRLSAVARAAEILSGFLTPDPRRPDPSLPAEPE